MQTNITTNIDEVLQKVQQLQHQGENLAPVFSEIANVLLNASEDAFETQKSAVTGQAWQALAASTLQQKAKQGKGDRQILESDFQLRETLAASSDATSAAVGVNATSELGYKYPAVHQFGSDDGKIVAREFLPFDENGDITPAIKREIIDIVVEYFQRA